MNFDDFKPLVGALETAGLPVLATIFTAAISPWTGPFAPMITSAAMALVPVMNTALGIPIDTPPDQTAATIIDDPDAAQSKLAAVQEDHKFTLDMVKQNQDYAVASQAQQVQINTVEAANPSMFVGGWRPALMWGIGGYLLMAIVLPYAVWAALQFGLHLTPPPEPSDLAIGILTALLGINVAARATEKVKGVDTPKIGGSSTKIVTTRK